MKARDIMTTDPVCCTPTQSASEVARMMRENDCGSLPVMDATSSRVVGIVTDRDIALRVVAMDRAPDVPVRDIMSDEPSCCSPEADTSEIERIMAQRQVRRVPVTDGNGRCVGLVAQADLAMHRDQLGDVAVAEVVARVSEPNAAPRRSG